MQAVSNIVCFRREIARPLGNCRRRVRVTIRAHVMERLAEHGYAQIEAAYSALPAAHYSQSRTSVYPTCQNEIAKSVAIASTFPSGRQATNLALLLSYSNRATSSCEFPSQTIACPFPQIAAI